MRVQLKLFASLSQYLPPEARRTSCVDLELTPGDTLGRLIEAEGIPPAQCTIVLVNGVFVAEAEWASRVLDAGDVVAIWPPVAGG